MATLLRWWKLFLLVVVHRRPLVRYPAPPDAPVPPQPVLEPLKVDPVTLLGMDIIPPPAPRRPSERPVKWVKPNGVDTLVHKPKEPRAEPKPRKPRPPKPETRPDTEDREQWGQYYFRDQILDQLDNYFAYLKRMRREDKDAYELHSKLGIQIMPQSAVNAFDKWRNDAEEAELSAWWLATRPGFGAVSYGIDRRSLHYESGFIADLSPEEFAKLRPRERETPENEQTYRIGTVTKAREVHNKTLDKTVEAGTMWVPKFLYFSKYKKPPTEVQKVVDGDVYSMTVYWDRTDDHVSRKWLKQHRGGIPQQYAVCVEKSTGKVRVLRQLIDSSVRLRDRWGDHFRIPNKRWGVPTDYLNWAVGREQHSPEDYLRRCFIEAALMYESAALGSLVRVEVTKGNLSAVFGVEIKRTSYFFKDRDVTLTTSGTRKPIFHIVRPHPRKTKHGEVMVPMHFRGLKEFEWAGYKVAITIPGRDHFVLPEIDIGMVQVEDDMIGKGYITEGELGKRLKRHLKEGLGGWKASGTQH
jgi:hypothetical protein